MFAPKRVRWKRSVIGAAALVILGGVAQAQEKANVTPPSGTNQPVEVTPPPSDKNPFRALDRESSFGGGLDNGAPLPALPQATMNPRIQKELLERFDRQRNFLFVEPSDNGAGTDIWLFESSTGIDNLPGSRRPQTLLERRLKGEKSTSATESVAKPAARADRSESLLGNNPEGSLDRRDSALGGRRDLPLGGSDDPERSSLAWPNYSNPAGTDDLVATLDDLRSALSAAGGRGLGLDRFTEERLQRLRSTEGDSTSRSGLERDLKEGYQPRGLRADSMEQLLAPATPTSSSSLDSLTADAPDSGVVARSPKPDPAALGIIRNVYSAPTPPAPPPVAPAVRMLKEPRPEPPRGRL